MQYPIFLKKKNWSVWYICAKKEGVQRKATNKIKHLFLEKSCVLVVYLDFNTVIVYNKHQIRQFNKPSSNVLNIKKSSAPEIVFHVKLSCWKSLQWKIFQTIECVNDVIIILWVIMSSRNTELMKQTENLSSVCVHNG